MNALALACPATEKRIEAGNPSLEIQRAVVEAFRWNVAEAERQLEGWQSGGEWKPDEVLDELRTAIERASAKHDEVSEMGVDRWEVALRKLSGAWRRLRRSLERAAAEYERRPALRGRVTQGR